MLDISCSADSSMRRSVVSWTSRFPMIEVIGFRRCEGSEDSTVSRTETVSNSMRLLLSDYFYF